MTKKRLLMAVYNRLSTDARVQRSAEALSTAFEVRVLSIADGRGSPRGAYDALPIALPALKPNALQHLYFWSRFVFEAIRFRPTLVYAHDFTLSLPGWLAARLVGASLIYDAHELLVLDDESPHGKRDREYYLFERFVTRRAELVIATNDERARIMSANYGLDHPPVVVRNIAPPPRVTRPPEQILDTFPALMAAAGTWRVIYQGNVSAERGLARYIEAFAELDRRFSLVVVGDGPDVAALRVAAEAGPAADRIIFLGPVSRAEVDEIMSVCHLGLVTYPSKGLNNIYCASNKLYDYAQAGLPVLSTPQPPLAHLIHDYGIGELVDIDAQDAPRAIAHGIRTLADGYDRYRSNLARFRADHTWASEARRLTDAVGQLAGTSR